MTMRPAITIALLLLSAAVVKSWEAPEDETEEEDDSSPELSHDMKENADHDAEEDQAFRGSCYACQSIVSKVKQLAGRDRSQARIRCLLMGVCNNFRTRYRSACRKVIRRYQYRLSSNIAKNRSSRRICARLRLCRRASQ